MLYKILKSTVVYLLYVFWRPIFVGRRHLCVTGPAIFIANHIKWMDPVLVALASPRIVRFLAKAELFSSKFAARCLRGLLALPINREMADITAIKTVLTLLKQGEVLGIFPEGHRSETGQIDPFENGAALFALRARVSVIPIYIKYLKWGRKYVAVGEPVEIRDLYNNGSNAAALSTATKRFYSAIAKLEAEAADIK